MRDYLDLCHAMQSGVAMKMNYAVEDTSPKHLRVGINSAMVNDAAIARLLMDKGVITEEEYTAAITEEMANEVARYEEWLTNKLGSATKITLR